MRYRPARTDDLPPALELFMESVNEMAGRHGLPGISSPPGDLPVPPRPAEPYEPPPTACSAHASPQAAFASSYAHILRTGIFEVAEEDDGRLVGIAHAIVREQVWFLSGFWVRPGHARQGIGGPLLRRVRDLGLARGATVFFTWSSVDLTAMATYLRLGLYPGVEILTFVGPPSSPPAPPPGFALQPLTVEVAGALDRTLRGVVRPEDHAFFATEKTGQAVLRDGQPVGYFYTGGGLIGPAGWLDNQAGDAVLALALQQARGQAEQVRIALAGSNHRALRFALGQGLRLVSNAHLLQSGPTGQPQQYIPSGPSLF